MFQKIFRRSQSLRWISNWKYRLSSRQLSTESDALTDELEDEDFTNLKKEIEFYLLPKTGHKVLLLQPSRTHYKLYLESGLEYQSYLEAKALINTLESWTLVDEDYVKNRNISGSMFFSKGVLERLTEQYSHRNDFTAVFLNWQYLSALQVLNLERLWNKIVYDRYTIVLQIFKLHARSAESKLQVQLAEMPYFRSRLYGYHLKTHSKAHLDQIDHSLSGLGVHNASMEDKLFILKTKEDKLKAKLKEIELRRDINRSGRDRSNLPVISVLGYTNAGKTALIKLLTCDEKVEPKNCFFATLDITYHDFYMKFNDDNFGMKIIIVDTIGFLSDIPTNLISAFRTTLRDTVDTDMLIHVVDVSNEYWETQMNFTITTLKSFRLPHKLMDSMITVGTKIDCINSSQLEEVMEKVPHLIPLSNKTGENITLLYKTIMGTLEKNLEYVTKKLKITQGSNIYQWIHANGVIKNCIPSSDGNKLLMDVMFLPHIWAKFQSKFYKKE